jgi:hypothetical protein
MTECATVKSRWIVVGVLLISAIAFAMSVWGGRWWSIGDVSIGPYGSTHCFGGECKHAGLGWIGGTDRWMRTGVATWAGGVLTMLALLGVAGAVAARRVPRLAAKMTLVAIATTLVAGSLFIAQYPGIAGATSDRGLWLFVVGVIAGIAATIPVLRARVAA